MIQTGRGQPISTGTSSCAARSTEVTCRFQAVVLGTYWLRATSQGCGCAGEGGLLRVARRAPGRRNEDRPSGAMRPARRRASLPMMRPRPYTAAAPREAVPAEESTDSVAVAVLLPVAAPRRMKLATDARPPPRRAPRRTVCRTTGASLMQAAMLAIAAAAALPAGLATHGCAGATRDRPACPVSSAAAASVACPAACTAGQWRTSVRLVARRSKWSPQLSGASPRASVRLCLVMELEAAAVPVA
mmetsp:Transcript_14176/g.36387  ORF Transcript_14176/g.36387 Transcript_14176/m.36387 type:complete len:245 (+) Transcript_14176:129-863(+)